MSSIAVRSPRSSQRLLELLTLSSSSSCHNPMMIHPAPCCHNRRGLHLPSSMLSISLASQTHCKTDILAITRRQSIRGSCVLATLDTLLQAYNGSAQGYYHFAISLNMLRVLHFSAFRSKNFSFSSIKGCDKNKIVLQKQCVVSAHIKTTMQV